MLFYKHKYGLIATESRVLVYNVNTIQDAVTILLKALHFMQCDEFFIISENSHDQCPNNFRKRPFKTRLWFANTKDVV